MSGHVPFDGTVTATICLDFTGICYTVTPTTMSKPNKAGLILKTVEIVGRAIIQVLVYV